MNLETVNEMTTYKRENGLEETGTIRNPQLDAELVPDETSTSINFLFKMFSVMNCLLIY